ncbi:MAG TPA: RagB/SusD family nutrient uptake outer membrane protein, partial [Bacteroidales bacterium]
MKKFKNILILILVVLFAACNDKFLNVDPLDKYSDAAVWKDPALVRAFVNNIYLGQHHGFQTEMLSSLCDESMDVWGWETQPYLTSNINSGYIGVLAPGFWCGAYDNLTWNNLYKNIRACNLFFTNIKSSGLTGSDIDQMNGEVHFLRGYFYYWLMSFYGGVPLIDKAFTASDDLLVSRNTFEETVNFIVADLDAAASQLPLSGDKALATKGAALTLKSRVLLYAASDLFNSNVSWSPGYAHPELLSYTSGDRTARWQAAKDAAKAVIDLNIYSLYGGTAPGSVAIATQNCINIFLNNGTNEDILLNYYDNVNNTNWNSPSVGLFNGPNGFNCWGGN